MTKHTAWIAALLCLLALAAVNALLALLAIFLCRGILNYAELKN